MSLRRDFRSAPFRTVAELIVIPILCFFAVTLLAAGIYACTVFWVTVL